MDMRKKVAIGVVVGVSTLAALSFLGLALICYELDKIEYYTMRDEEYYC